MPKSSQSTSSAGGPDAAEHDLPAFGQVVDGALPTADVIRATAALPLPPSDPPAAHALTVGAGLGQRRDEQVPSGATAAARLVAVADKAQRSSDGAPGETGDPRRFIAIHLELLDQEAAHRILACGGNADRQYAREDRRQERPGLRGGDDHRGIGRRLLEELEEGVCRFRAGLLRHHQLRVADYEDLTRAHRRLHRSELVDALHRRQEDCRRLVEAGDVRSVVAAQRELRGAGILKLLTQTVVR